MGADARTASASGGTAAQDAAVPSRSVEMLYRAMPAMVRMLHQGWTAMSYEDAQDAVQEAFEELLNQHRPVEYPFNWVLTVARRRWWRQRSRQTVLVDLDSSIAFNLVDSAPTPSERLLDDEAAEELVEEIERLRLSDGRYLTRYAFGTPMTELAETAGVDEEKMRLRINAARRAFHRHRLSTQADRLTPISSPDGRARPGETGKALLATLAALPQRQREVLELAVDGMRPREIAAAVGLTANATRVNLHHAKKKVAEHLGLEPKQVVSHLARMGSTAAVLANSA